MQPSTRQVVVASAMRESTMKIYKSGVTRRVSRSGIDPRSATMPDPDSRLHSRVGREARPRAEKQQLDIGELACVVDPPVIQQSEPRELWRGRARLERRV